MGMAAGQARLLSITSRMSDNELRAQIINNNKMRLAAESSQASEAYITALNQAQLMFTSYDADNNASYKPLTFNALTGYSPYNNQYSLINSSGNILVSEKDATNFIKAKGSANPLATFLQQYGLEYSTTYFTNIAKHAEIHDGKFGIPYKTGYDYKEGEDILSYIDLTSVNDATTITDDMIDKMATQLNNSFDNYSKFLSEDGHNSYQSYLNEYEIARDEWEALAAENVKNLYTSITTNDANYSGQNISGLRKSLDKLDGDNFANYTKALSNYWDQLKGYLNTDENTTKYINTLTNKIGALTPYYNVITADGKLSKTTKTEYDGSTINIISFDPTEKKKLDADGKEVLDGEQEDKFSLNYNVVNGKIIPDETATVEIYDENRYQKIQGCAVSDYDGENKYVITYYTEKPSNDESKENAGNAAYSNTAKVGYVPQCIIFDIKTQTVEYANKATTVEEYKQIFDNVLNELENCLYTYYNPTDTKITGDYTSKANELDEAYKKLMEAAQNLLSYYAAPKKDDKGNETPTLPELADIVNYVRELDDIKTIDEFFKIKGDNGPKYNLDTTNYKNIENLLVANLIMDTYGEAQYNWIVKGNENENGEAKAAWYENLFKHMEKGYQVLTDGLASSPEWIQFAFESGIVTMEQVDEKQEWKSLIYSSCSDIIEQTDSLAIAKAEAEYKAAMNKIENKDKRYDLELKNIDTEHNSLQTEYDSIKNAIDKNIDRTFKIYM